MNLRNYKFNSNGELYSLKIMYSSAQGKKQLKEYVKQAYFCQYFEWLLYKFIYDNNNIIGSIEM